ncbi:GAP family protein [Arthrobacter alpinus]|nr:GAP family protein [Arthrobacter alpinus]
MPGSGRPAPAPAAELKWQTRLSKALRSPGGMVGLALVAGLLELPTMVPYLVAIGFLSNSTLPLPGAIGLLVVYCLLMLVPALILLGLRAAAGTWLDSLIHRVSSKMSKFSGETVLWVLGIVGFLLLRAGLTALAPAAAWNPFK